MVVATVLAGDVIGRLHSIKGGSIQVHIPDLFTLWSEAESVLFFLFFLAVLVFSHGRIIVDGGGDEANWGFS